MKWFKRLKRLKRLKEFFRFAQDDKLVILSSLMVYRGTLKKVYDVETIITRLPSWTGGMDSGELPKVTR